MTTETKESFEDWLTRIAEIKPWVPSEGSEPIDMYVSRKDGGFLIFSNLTEDIRWMYNNGIEPQKKSPEGNTCTIGFSPQTQKWWGWSHRACYGFGIGHEVKKEDVGYHAKNEDDFLEWAINFWKEDEHADVKGIKDMTSAETGELGCVITWTYTDRVPNEELHGTIGETFMFYPKDWGKGEWKAQTLDDAKLMAMDFANEIS